jgi:EAL domain-containing protein (putative c-di-GMP-specific phosphodiesterase class I)
MLKNKITNILVIDDDDFILSLTIGVLQKLGYKNVDTATNGIDALEKLDRASPPYSVTICDLNMPEMDGIEFMRHAHQRNYAGGLILLSGEDKRILDLALEMADLQNLNILGCLTKPVKMSALRDILGENSSLPESESTPNKQQKISKDELMEGLEPGSNRLQLHYQPIVHIRSGDIVGVESVPIWNHPTRGILEPQTFFPVAQEHLEINALSIKIYDKAVEQTARWLTDGIFLQNFIGLSFETLTSSDHVDLLLNKPTEFGITKKHINLKISDQDIDSKNFEINELLMRFHFKKIGVAIDDFNLGQADIDKVSHFPYSQIRSNRELLLSTKENPELAPVVKKNNSLAKKLNLEVTIKGIQDREEWNQAENLGFDCVQGEFCSDALPNTQLLEFLENWNPPPRRC